MDIAEKLYQKGFISYPRTETNAFPSSINIKELVSRLNDSAEFGMYVRKLLEDNKYTSPKAGNQNDHAHTPIHPVKIANK
jgi:DNA topoisomerase-3